jgi:hypothetical protein
MSEEVKIWTMEREAEQQREGRTINAPREKSGWYM